MTKTEKAIQARAERTAKLLAYFHNCPEEFGMLKGILCMSHPFDYFSQEGIHTRDLFDTMAIAERMDSITGARRKLSAPVTQNVTPS